MLCDESWREVLSDDTVSGKEERLHGYKGSCESILLIAPFLCILSPSSNSVAT